MGLLPSKEEVSIPSQNMEDYNFLIYGLPGSGKTSLANEFDDSLLVLFEKGTTGLMTNEVNLIEQSEKTGKMVWELFKQTKKEVMAGEHPYKTIVVDTITRAYEYAMDYVIETKLDGIHPSETEFNSGYSKLNKELKKEFNELLSSDLGIVLLSHVKRKNVKDIKGNERSRLVADTGGSFSRFIMGEMDIVIFYDKDENKNRILRVEGTKDFDAKQRLQFPNGDIEAGKDAKSTYKKLFEEFNVAIGELNDKLGVTKEMIDDHYNRKKAKKEKQKKLSNLKDKIIDLAKEKQLNPKKNAFEMNKQIGVDKVSKISNLDNAKKYIDYLKNYEG